MAKKLSAVYQKGAFIPTSPCHFPENAEVELTVEAQLVTEPEVKDPEERLRIIQGVIERMRKNPLPAGSPKFTREALHDRG
jgi:hypothetical protein